MTVRPESTTTAPPGLWQPADLEGLRARYRAERDRRLRPEGEGQFLGTQTGELSAYAADPWVDGVAPRDPVTDEVDVAIVGAGFGGLLAGTHLRKAGVDRIRMIDIAGDVGGTWYWNRYPGIACDIESYIYLPLLEEVGDMPTRRYAGGDEIRRQAVAIAERYDLKRDALFGTEVTAVEWDDDARRWLVRTDHDDAFHARYIVLSGGPFVRPKLPGIAGLAEFTGHTFHTSRWDYDYTGGGPGAKMDRIADKRIAVIGTGATAIQVVPELAEAVEHLYVVQRTPSGVDTRDDAPTDPQWWESLEPGWQRARRENFQALVHGRGAPENQVGDKWTDTAPVRGLGRLARGAGSEDPALAMELADHEKMEEIRARVAEIIDDPATAEALQPWYRQMCKRPAFSDRYLQAFNRDNVDLVDTGGKGVERMTEHGFVVDGVEYPVDAVVFATGFSVGIDAIARSGAVLRGRGGLTLREYWADGVRSLHGWVSRGFPNLFYLGSTQNTYSVNFTHILEEQAAHLGAVVAEAERRGAVLVEPSAEAEQAWVRTVHEGGQHTAQAAFEFSAECTPGYYNGEGQPIFGARHFAGGPAAFHDLLDQWRREGGIDEVLGAPVRPGNAHGVGEG